MLQATASYQSSLTGENRSDQGFEVSRVHLPIRIQHHGDVEASSLETGEARLNSSAWSSAPVLAQDLPNTAGLSDGSSVVSAAVVYHANRDRAGQFSEGAWQNIGGLKCRDYYRDRIHVPSSFCRKALKSSRVTCQRRSP